MKNNFVSLTLLAIAVCSLAALAPSQGRAAENDSRIRVVGRDDRQLVKIALSGFTGEALTTLKFDLEVIGCAVTSADQALFLITGSNTDHLEGRVQDKLTQTYVLGKAYPAGVDIRKQAHKFADDIAKTLFKMPGIALTKIAYKKTRGATSELYISDYDGHNAIQITSDNSIVAAPAWVPGRRKVYYTSYRLGNPDIYSQDLDTGERRVVARYSGLNTSPSISPDGSRVAMILSKAGSPDLWVSDASGGGLKQLTTTHEDESSPCWSPDERTICFTSRASQRAALYTISPDGGAMKRLSTSGAINCTEPDWSPDGKYITFTSLMGTFQICVLEVATGRMSILTDGEDATWAPNSRTLIIARRVGGKYVLSLLDVRTKQVKDIPQLSGNCSQPAWAR
jgi:TolB protein